MTEIQKRAKRGLEKKQFTITLNDGKELGTVGYSAYKAMKNNTVDSYVPKNDAEKKVINAYRSRLQTKTAEERQSGANFSSAPSSSFATNKPTDYSSAVKYLNGKGVQGASGIMTENEWRRRNKSGGTYQNYLDSVISKYDKGATAPQTTESSVKKSTGEKILDSAGYIGEKVGRGVVDGIEGVTDFAWSVPLALGWGITSGFGLFENSASRKINEWYNYVNEDDITDYWGVAEDRYDAAPQGVKDWGWLPETIGNIVPFIAETIYTAGTSTIDDLAVAGKSVWDAGRKFLTNPDVHFGMSAGGNSIETAVEKGANPITATTYGAAAGALEVATEKLFGGYAGTGVGKTATTAIKEATDATNKTLLKKIWNSPVTKKIFDIASEGIEEDIVTFADPILQKTTGVDANAEWATWSDYVESGTHGIILSIAMNALGVPRRLIAKYGKSKTISRINESAETLNGLIQDDKLKLKPLSSNATEEEIVARQKEVSAVALAFDNAVKKAVQSEQQTITEKRTTQTDTLEQAAMDVVASRNAKNQPVSSTPVSDARKAAEQMLKNDFEDEALIGDGYTSVSTKMKAQLEDKAMVESTTQFGETYYIQRKPDGKFFAMVEGEGSGGFVANELNKECDSFEEAYISCWEYIFNRNPDLYSKTIEGYLEDSRAITEDSTPAQEGNELKTPKNAQRSTSKEMSLAERLETQSKNNEPLSVEDVKKATGFGEEGSKLITRLANSEGITFSQAKSAVETAYAAGLANVESSKVNFETDTQIDAFTAGKKDWVMQDLAHRTDTNQNSVDRFYDIKGSNVNSVTDKTNGSTENPSVNEDATNMDDTAENNPVRMYEIMDELGLTYDEQSGIIDYKSGESYSVNSLLRGGEELSDKQKKIKNGLNSALKKFPVYKGVVYRNIGFMTKEDLDNFILEHEKEISVTYPAFTSASKTIDGYVVEAPYLVHYEIESVDGRDVSQIGIKSEKEILFATDTTFEILNIEKNENYLSIKMREVNQNGKGKSERTLEERGEQQTSEGNASENGYKGNSEEIHSASDVVRGGSAAYDEIYRGTSNSDSRGTERRSGADNKSSVGEAGDAAMREGKLLGIDDSDVDKFETYDIPEGSEIVNNIVVDEHSKRLKRENPRAYSNIIRMARRLEMNVRFVKNLTGENGKVLEGLITSRGIFINADAKNPSRFVATHEFGHRMKQAAPKVWAKYQEYVINKLKKESFDSGRIVYDILYEETKNAYGKDDADYINEEIAVNYAGELFDSEEMLESFIREDKGLAIRVRDWWYNVLESMGLLSEKKKAQQLWLKAYTAAAKNVAEGKVGAYSGEKFKIVTMSDGSGRKYVHATQRVIKSENPDMWESEIYDYINNVVRKGEDVIIPLDNEESITITEKTAWKTSGQGKIKGNYYLVKGNAAGVIDEIIEVSKSVDSSPPYKEHKDGFAKYGFDYRKAYFMDIDGKYYELKLSVGINAEGKEAYDIERIKRMTFPSRGSKAQATKATGKSSSKDNVPQTVPTVNSYSMQNTTENAQEGKKSIAGTRLSELVEKYGAIPSGEKPHRNIQVPKKTAKDKKVSQTVRTILEAKATPDEAVPTIEKMVEDGTFSYDVYTDKQAINDADSYIKEYGWDKSLMDWFSAVEKGVASKQHTAIGWALYNNAANIAATTTSETERTTAINTSLNILDAMVRHQRSAAQALQATRILKKLSPETQLYGVQKSIQALRKELVDKYGDKAPNLKIDEELAEQYLKAETQEEREAIEKEIYKDIGRQMPSRFIDKWNAVRYLSMLTNLRTHIRNISGNAVFAPFVIAKDLTATAIESVVYRVSGKKMVRGKALIVGSKADRELLKAAWSDYANVADIVSNGGKYSDHAMANQYIEEGRKIFKSKTLERVRKTNSDYLEKEDVWFSKPHYAYALAQYCKANNITAEQIKKGKAIRPARVYAIKEAQKATYKDTNEFSQWVSSFGRRGKNNNKIEKVVGPAVEGVLPYRRVPANVLVRAAEYSPYGLLKGLSHDLVKVSKGEMTATEAIDNISAGLTGVGLTALGAYLAAQCFVRGRGEDDEEEREFKELMGHQAYALELPNGKSITLDWLAPEALPFFVGVNLWEATKGSGEKVNLSSILSAISNITEPMLEMSCLQSLNELLEGIGYAKSNDMSSITAILASATTSYLTQSIPTLLGQAERTGEENRMTTYTEKNDFLTKGVQYTLGKISSKIPFVEYHQIPYIDAWGRKEASGTALKRGFNNFLNPAYTSTINESDMEKELLRLYEKTGDNGVFPERADKYFVVDGVRKDLTAEEYVRYATLKGEKSYKAVSDLVESKAYKKLTDSEKAKAVQEAYTYADQKAKQAVGNYKPDSWVKKADAFGSNIGNYISFRTNVSSTRENNGDKISKQEVVDIILDMAQNDSETWKMYLSMYDSDKDMYAYDRGIDGETYMYFLESLDDVDRPTESGKYGTYTQEEAYSAIRQLDGLSRKEKAILWQSVNTSWKASKNPFR